LRVQTNSLLLELYSFVTLPSVYCHTAGELSCYDYVKNGITRQVINSIEVNYSFPCHLFCSIIIIVSVTHSPCGMILICA